MNPNRLSLLALVLPVFGGCLPLLPLPKGDTGATDTVPSDTIVIGDDDDDDDGVPGDDDDDDTTTSSTTPSTTPTTTTTPSGPVTVTVFDLQGGQVVDGTAVEVLDVVITATTPRGFYVQERGGGPGSAIWVLAGAGWEGTWPVEAGDRVDLEGVFDDSGTVSTLDLVRAPAPDVRVVGWVQVPAPEVVPLAALQGAAAEAWEGVLIRVEGVAIADPDAGGGAFVVGDAAGRTLVVEDHLHRWSALGEVPVGATVAGVSGVLHQDAGYELVPRDEADIELAAVDLFEVNQGLVPVGTEVELFGVVVTGVAYDGLYVQDEAGGPYSGAWVYLGTYWELIHGQVSAGDRVHLWGQAAEYNGLTEIDLVSSAAPRLQVAGAGPVPAPQLITVADAGEPWEGVLVEVRDVVVVSPDLGFGEWSVTPRLGGGGATVVVDDRIHAYGGLLSVGARFDAVVGPLHYSFGAFKLQPRDASDIVPH